MARLESRARGCSSLASTEIRWTRRKFILWVLVQSGMDSDSQITINLVDRIRRSDEQHDNKSNPRDERKSIGLSVSESAVLAYLLGPRQTEILQAPHVRPTACLNYSWQVHGQHSMGTLIHIIDVFVHLSFLQSTCRSWVQARVCQFWICCAGGASQDEMLSNGKICGHNFLDDAVSCVGYLDHPYWAYM